MDWVNKEVGFHQDWVLGRNKEVDLQCLKSWKRGLLRFVTS